jgi:hypothetical protein
MNSIRGKSGGKHLFVINDLLKGIHFRLDGVSDPDQPSYAKYTDLAITWIVPSAAFATADTTAEPTVPTFDNRQHVSVIRLASARTGNLLTSPHLILLYVS